MGKGELELKRFQLPENIAGKGEPELKRFQLPENIAGKGELERKSCLITFQSVLTTSENKKEMKSI